MCTSDQQAQRQANPNLCTSLKLNTAASYGPQLQISTPSVVDGTGLPTYVIIIIAVLIIGSLGIGGMLLWWFVIKKFLIRKGWYVI